MASAAVIQVTKDSFDQEVLQAKVPVVVDFWAQWCGPCKMLGPVLDEIATEQAGRVKVAKVDIDHNPRLAAQFGIQSIPTLIYFANGKARHQSLGIVSRKTTLGTLETLAVAA